MITKLGCRLALIRDPESPMFSLHHTDCGANSKLQQLQDCATLFHNVFWRPCVAELSLCQYAQNRKKESSLFYIVSTLWMHFKLQILQLQAVRGTKGR